jgi:hypothetical protein
VTCQHLIVTAAATKEILAAHCFIVARLVNFQSVRRVCPTRLSKLAPVLV